MISVYFTKIMKIFDHKNLELYSICIPVTDDVLRLMVDLRLCHRCIHHENFNVHRSV